MTDQQLKAQVLERISKLHREQYHVVLVHGGGPFIQKALESANIVSEFVEGHRVTTPEILRHAEMALKGEVNGSIVNLLNTMGVKAVGLSGKDGQLVIARKRYHQVVENGNTRTVDIGQVGEVDVIQPRLVEHLLDDDYLPVITCIASDREGNDYNINADLFAGSLAGALKAELFILLTDVDGLYEDIDRPDSLIRSLNEEKIAYYKEKGVIAGGMLPKTESCMLALEGGARKAMIMNGTKPELLEQLLEGKTTSGTEITQ